MTVNPMEELQTTAVAIATSVGSMYQSAHSDALVTGSMVEGFGNATSDVDLILVQDMEPPVVDGEHARLQYDTHTTIVTYHQDRRVDIEWWTPPEIRRQLQVLSAVNRQAMETISPTALETAHSIVVGIPIGGALHQSLIGETEDWKDRLVKVLSYQRISAYSGYAEDAVGAIKSEDYGTALLTSRYALGATMDAYLAQAGETNPKPKWRIRKIQRLGDQDLLNSYLDAEMDLSLNPTKILLKAKRRLMLAADLAANVQVESEKTSGG